jgi:hypothetical protein
LPLLFEPGPLSGMSLASAAVLDRSPVAADHGAPRVKSQRNQPYGAGHEASPRVGRGSQCRRDGAWSAAAQARQAGLDLGLGIRILE